MNLQSWLNAITLIFKLAGPVTTVIEADVAAARSGADKHILAQATLMQATGIADAVLSPGNAALADAMSAITSTAINQAVTINKANGTFDKIVQSGQAAFADAASVGAALKP